MGGQRNARITRKQNHMKSILLEAISKTGYRFFSRIFSLGRALFAGHCKKGATQEKHWLKGKEAENNQWISLRWLLLVFILGSTQLYGQDLLSELDSTGGEEKQYVIATFKTTRLVNQHTLETLGRRTLDFRISHRFGPVNSGSYDAWGIDGAANIRLGLEYSPNGRFMFGIGRSSFEKVVDGFLKYRLIRQTDDDKTPFSLTLFAGAYYTALKNVFIQNIDKFEHTSSRFSYCYEAMIGRKFSRKFSLQIAPWFVHYNLVDRLEEKNDVYGLSALTRFKFSNRSAITAEYGMALNDYSPQEYFNTFSIGYELETGGHVFQIHFTNSFGIVENQFFPHTDTEWNDMGVRLGFNISRVFTL